MAAADSNRYEVGGEGREKGCVVKRCRLNCKMRKMSNQKNKKNRNQGKAKEDNQKQQCVLLGGWLFLSILEKRSEKK